MDGVKKILLVIFGLLFTVFSYSQITSGKITFERRTNLKKKYGDNQRMKSFITEENKIRKEIFNLHFDESRSSFIVVEDPNAGKGYMNYTTQRNKTYQNLEKDEMVVVIDLFGNNAYVKDKMPNRAWKITESKRKIGGYMCRKAIWEKNDSTRIYAWFSVDIVPSIGPEGFGGLPGAILGLATEDGGVIYFARKVDTDQFSPKSLEYEKANKFSTIEELKIKLESRFSGKPWGKGILEDIFKWY